MAGVSSWLRTGTQPRRVPVVALETARTAELLSAGLRTTEIRSRTDKRSGITNDPNRAADPEYIARLIGQVITVSLETMKIVNTLPELRIQASGGV